MATIIKHPTPAQPSGTMLRGAAYNLKDMTLQAEDYLTTVRQEAIQIIQQARQEAATIRLQAEQAGRQVAQEAIEKILDEKVAQQMQALVPALDAAVTQIEDSKQQWLQHWETALIKLSTSIAAHIIRCELKTEPELSLEWIREALRLAAGSAEVSVHLHPNDLETLRGEVDRLAALFCPLAKGQIVADPSITAGGCRVETQFGAIDVQLETQLARVEQELA
jgi:flagellar assembly protein FliH